MLPTETPLYSSGVSFIVQRRCGIGIKSRNVEWTRLDGRNPGGSGLYADVEWDGGAAAEAVWYRQETGDDGRGAPVRRPEGGYGSEALGISECEYPHRARWGVRGGMSWSFVRARQAGL